MATSFTAGRSSESGESEFNDSESCDSESCYSGSYDSETYDFEPYGYKSYDPTVVHNHTHFVTGLLLIVEYINFGNSFEEIVHIRDSSRWWCESYFDTPDFPRNDLPVVLKDHPNIFNLGIFSRSRLEPPPPRDDGDDDGNDGVINTDTDPPTDFPFYCEPSFFDDATLDDMADEVAALQQDSQQFGDEDVSTSQPVYATALKNTSIIQNIPDIMASLARLNMAAMKAGSQEPTFVPEMDIYAASRSYATRRWTSSGSERSLSSSSSSSSSSDCFMSVRSGASTESSMVIGRRSGCGSRSTSLDRRREVKSTLLGEVMETNPVTGRTCIGKDDALGTSHEDHGEDDAEENQNRVWGLFDWAAGMTRRWRAYLRP